MAANDSPTSERMDGQRLAGVSGYLPFIPTAAASGDGAASQRSRGRDECSLTRNVILYQLDGKIPNIALMRIAEHHRQLGDDVELRWTGNPERALWDEPKAVYASAIFEKTKPKVEKLLREFPGACVGGTGVDLALNLEDVGVTTKRQDYSIYPKWDQSIGFTQRGCRLKCSFCVVPRKEGKMREEMSIAELWRGNPHVRELILLDNDFFGQPRWRERVAEIREGGFRVSFNQGINARFLTDEAAEAVASMDYRDDSMKVKRIYTAWDNRKDEERLFAGLNRLVKYGVKPDHIMVYILVGYWPGETIDDCLYRQSRLRDFGARPYPMPFKRTKELVGFQRWVVGAYDKRITWHDWVAADYEPRNLTNFTPAVADTQPTLAACARGSRSETAQADNAAGELRLPDSDARKE